MDDHELIEKHFSQLIEKMKQQIKNPKHQSFGSLENHLQYAIESVKSKRYLNPLYFVSLPRWLGEVGNTELEEEIFNISHEIDALVIRINGGKEIVNEIRNNHNKRNTQ